MTTNQEEVSHPPTPRSINFSAKDRAGMQTLLDLYGDCVLVGAPPSLARRKELTALAGLLEKLAVLETMQDGEGIEIDTASLLVVQHACTFFLASATLLPFDKQVRAVVRAAAAEIKWVLLESQSEHLKRA
jgi:hypothetical protein